MAASSIACLTDRALIRISGPDAWHYLQNLITSDIGEADRNGAVAAALLTPQGKILFDFLIYRHGDGYLLDTPNATADDLQKRLTFYRLRAKVELEALSAETGVFAAWGDPVVSEKAILSVADPRLAALGQRLVGPVAELEAEFASSLADMATYDAHRIRLGVPEGLKDFDYSDVFPHDADLDQLGGVSFQKGCYVGQEVVSRMQHRGTARKRFVRITSDVSLPEKGASVTVDGKSVGTLGSSTALGGQSAGLALLRLDKVHQATDKGSLLQCGDAAIQVEIPDWATFTWPEPGAAD